MTDLDTIPAELVGRFRSRLVLKQDVFSTVERGSFLTPNGEVEAVMRRIDLVPWWSAGIAKHFLKREARGLARRRWSAAGSTVCRCTSQDPKATISISGPRGVRCAASTANA